MKKFFITMLMLFSVFGIAMAQGPAMIVNGQVDSESTQVDNVLTNQVLESRDVLQPEIYNWLENIHYSHPNAGLSCVIDTYFKTTQEYDWYRWESSYAPESVYDRYQCTCFEPGYIKVTVGDNAGNIGTDSIWFDIDGYVTPLDDFILEIGDDLYPTLSSTIALEYERIDLMLFLGNARYYVNHLTPEPGTWSFKDEEAPYCQDTLWRYLIDVYDTCWNMYRFEAQGMFLSTTQQEDNWYLDMKTSLNTYGISYSNDYVYFVYSIDEFGQRHHFIDENGTPVILQGDENLWEIKNSHIDPYYQCGVAQMLENGDYKLLSLSNKVPNPLQDISQIGEAYSNPLSVYPNPSSGSFTVKGAKNVIITNSIGQLIATSHNENCNHTFSLGPGIYFVKSRDGAVSKIVVQ